MTDSREDKKLAELSAKEREEALQRYALIKPYLMDNVPLSRLVVSTGISYRTLNRWVQMYRQNGLGGLISKKRRDRGTNRCISAELRLCIEGLALQNPLLSIMAIYRMIVDLTKQRGWNTPAYKTVYNIIKTLHPALVILAHEGRKAYCEKYDLLYKRESIYPNEIWQADHSLLDIWVVDDNSNHKRPWLTIIMDDYSRAVAGYFLTLQNPNTQNTSLALRQAIWHKPDPRWHICGIPDMFYTDHGSDFTSNHLEQVSADIKMRLIFSLPGVPRGRGIIERFFETVNQLFLSALPGYMPGGEYPKKPPTLKLNELDSLFGEFLISDYNLRIHSETNMAPRDRWAENASVPRLPESLEQLDLLLLTVTKTRKVHPDGIHFHRFKIY